MILSGAGRRPSFLVTIDTEGDNLWERPRRIRTENSRFLPRFQRLCEKFGLKPTYLTNFEMAHCDVFREFGSDLLRRGTAEIGMHLHAWNTPPLVPLTEDDLHWQPYLVEYPADVIRQKVRVMTDLLGKRFGVTAVSHRAGRWALDSTYAQVLVDCGYTVDCSVTPNVSWRNSLGHPQGPGGADYSSFPETPYFLDLTDLGRAGTSGLLEVPMTVRSLRRRASARVPPLLLRASIVRRLLNRLFPVHWLRPRGQNLGHMLNLLRAARREQADHVEFMLHSSELMPGGSPTFRTPVAIDKLFRDVEVLFEEAARHFTGRTVAEYRALFSAPTVDRPAEGLRQSAHTPLGSR